MDTKSNAGSNGVGGKGKLGVLIPGMGAVATTFMAGVEAIRAGRGTAVGSLTQLGWVPAGGGNRRVSELLDLASLDELVFGGWDIFEESALEVARRSRVLERAEIEELAPFLDRIRPMRGAFDRRFVRNLDGTHIIAADSLREQVEVLRENIKAFARDNGCTRLVMIWCGSTEVHTPEGVIHQSLADFEAALDQNHESISPSQLYLYAALLEGVPYINGAPNPGVEFRCFQELAIARGVPIAGSDFKTGQTFLKTVIAPALRTRQLGVRGWYSTNILGNRDGEVLDDPGSFRSKEVTKAGVLSGILSSEEYPDLYSELSHVVRINYYPPRGDNKEGWDNIDLFGWLGYPMQLKINFLCRDSILAAPLVLDLVLLMDIAARQGRSGLQSWLSYFFKSPAVPRGERVEHDLGLQWRRLEEEIRRIAGIPEPAALISMPVSVRPGEGLHV